MCCKGFLGNYCTSRLMGNDLYIFCSLHYAISLYFFSSDWPMVVRQLRTHRDFSVYFSEGRTQDSGSESGSDLDSPLAIDTTLRVGERARYQVNISLLYFVY